MNVVLATCASMPEGTDDDRLFADALRSLGQTVSFAVWSSPMPDADRVVIRSTWDYQRSLPEFLSWCRRTPNLVNHPDVIEWNSSKRYLANLPHALESHFDGAPRMFAGTSKRAIVKPIVSASAELTFKCETIEEQRRAIDEIVRAGREPMIQPFVDSIATDGEISLVYFGGEFSHALRKIPKQGDFRVQQNFGGTLEVFKPTRAHLRVAEDALAAVPSKNTRGDRPLGYARVDVVDFAKEPRIGELELIEPELFFRLDEKAAMRAAIAITK